jgi:hypothetical protein
MAVIIYIGFGGNRGITKRCRLSWLTNSVLVYEPKRPPIPLDLATHPSKLSHPSL